MLRLLHGDMRKTLRVLPDNSVDSVGTDPPYHLTSIVRRFGADNAAPAKVGATGAYARASAGFMGQQWDGGDVAFQPETWAEIWRVLKPGGHMIAFSGTRTYHRMVCAIEDAGFEIRDQLAWAYGSGFPKSHDVSKGIDKAAGAERGRYTRASFGGTFSDDGGTTYGTALSNIPATPEAERWQGWGTALKPAWEPICLARKPLSEPTVAANVLRWGTGAINIDGCRIGGNDAQEGRERHGGGVSFAEGKSGFNQKAITVSPAGRWPANFVHDGSPDVLEQFPAQAGALAPVHTRGADKFRNAYGTFAGNVDEAGSTFRGDSGSAARFFYCAKASKSERGEHNTHPTVKPVALMEWLVRMVTPARGVVLDPFLGSGSTAVAAVREGFSFIGCELSAEYIAITERRLDALTA